MSEDIKQEGSVCSQGESGRVDPVVVSPPQPIRETVDAQFVQITADNDVVSCSVNVTVVINLYSTTTIEACKGCFRPDNTKSRLKIAVYRRLRKKGEDRPSS